MNDWDFLCDLEGEELKDAMEYANRADDSKYTQQQKKKEKITKKEK